MGSLTFLTPTPLPVPVDQALHRAYLAGPFDQMPMACMLSRENGQLIVSREQHESCYFMMPWPVAGWGELITGTSTLRERDEPYRLIVELARGKLNHVRCQTADWLAMGLRSDPAFDAAMSAAIRQFASALLAAPTPESDAAAELAIRQGYELADRLVRAYIAQVFEARHSEEGKLATRLAARIARPLTPGPAADLYRQSFNAAQLGFRWRDLEPTESKYVWDTADQLIRWAQDIQFPLTAGPIIDLSAAALPEWMQAWEGDFPSLAAFTCDFVETVISRYHDRVKRWVVCAGFNRNEALGLSDEERQRLAARLFEAARQVDPDLELILSVAQPWGDYLTEAGRTISPLSFADDLVRTGLPIAAIELELRVGCSPRGGWGRDILDVCKVVDYYSMLGLPIELVLSGPSATGADPQADGQQTIGVTGWGGEPTPERQAQWGASVAALGLCKPHVRAVTWDAFADTFPHLAPHSGLLDATGAAKPLLASLAALCTEHLQ